jgi:hypothetical protein
MASPAKWAALAHALDLNPYAPSATYSYGASFRQMKRTLGVPAAPPPSFQHHLYGVRHGVEIMVLTYDVGSGSSQTTYTAVLARIDPPLFLGLALRPRSGLERLFGSVDFPLGDADADQALHVRAFDTRPALLLSPADPQGRALLQHLVAQARSDWLPAIADSVVTLERAGTYTDPREIAQVADWAIALARGLAGRRRAVPHQPHEAKMNDEWHRFADGAGFGFDPERMKLQGKAGDSAAEIALETDGQHVRTSVSMTFPRAVGVAMFVQRTTLPGFLQGLFSQDIRVGDPAFDQMYKVTGQPVEAVRDALARPALLAVLKQLGGVTTSVQMNHRELYFRVDGCLATQAHLAETVALGRTATAALFGEVSALGPYR